MTKIDDLMEMMACPKCKGEVKLDKENDKIICNNCRLKYPILEGEIPDMLVEDSEKF